MNKDKLILTISIGLTALVLSGITFLQFKTVEQTDITAIETMRETELRTELSSWKAKYDEISLKLAETENTILQYRTELASASNASEVAKQEVKDFEKYLGYTDLQGQGVVVTLQDNEFKNIESYDLLSLVNELKLAGAEAVSINDERIVSTTDITMINNRIILVNTRRISGPYVVKAIGDKKYLESAITIKGGYYDDMIANDKTINYEISNRIEINKFNQTLELENAKVDK